MYFFLLSISVGELEGFKMHLAAFGAVLFFLGNLCAVILSGGGEEGLISVG
jgi:hypothetical protein